MPENHFQQGDYANYLRGEREKPSVSYQRFMENTTQFPHHLFCFFEGKDHPYYVPRIKRYTENYYPIDCKGRENVKKVHALIQRHGEYANYKLAYFIDRDFNSANTHPDSYETPCYSIENLYVNRQSFREIVINQFHLAEGSESFHFCMETFEQRLNDFNEAMTLFNAWYACLIDHRNATGQKTGVTLAENKFPKAFLSFSLDAITQNYTLETLYENYPTATRISIETLNEKLEQFNQCDKSATFRGKFQLYFMLDLITEIIRKSKDKSSVFKQPIKYLYGDGSNVNLAQALNNFTSYAITPNCLEQYLQTKTYPNKL